MTTSNIPNNLLMLRKMVNATQDCMANIIGVSRVTYTRYELGDRNIDAILLFNLADHFNCPTDLFGEDSVEDFALKFIENRDYSAESKKLLSLFNKLSGFEKGMVIHYCEDLVAKSQRNRDLSSESKANF